MEKVVKIIITNDNCNYLSNDNSFLFVSQKKSLVTYVTMVPQVGNATLLPLGVVMGNTVSEAYIEKHNLFAGDSL